MTEGRINAESANEPEIPPGNKSVARYAFFITLGFLVLLIAASILVEVATRKWRGISSYLNNGVPFSVQGFVIGMIPGMMFGFIDQMMLWISNWSGEPMTLTNMFGDALTPIFPGGSLLQKGWGNTVSDTVAVTCSVIVSRILSTISGKESPLYTEILGVIIGCVAGMYVPYLITGKT